MMNTINSNFPKLEDILLVDLPECIQLLPEDWKGNTKRVWMRLTISKQAIDNEKFNLRGFIKAKFNNALKVIQKRNNVDKLCITQYLAITVDMVSDNEKAILQIDIEYAI
jgi:hypothetical protein